MLGGAFHRRFLDGNYAPEVVAVLRVGYRTISPALSVASVVSEAFAITQDDCTGTTLAPGAFCVIEFRFEPPDIATYSADFAVTSTAVSSPDQFRLIGIGVFDELFGDRFEEN